MKRKGMTIKEASYEWVREFSHIPQDIIRKLMERDGDDVMEITPFTIGNRVYVYEVNARSHSGTIIDALTTSDRYLVELDDGCSVEIGSDDMEHEFDYVLPIWGTMWAFGDSLDNEWIESDGLQIMANCGFRIYEQEDYGYIFGIDGAGYDFYEDHWIPLYKARGLQWHDEETEKEGVCQ